MSCLKSYSSAASLKATLKGVLSRVTYELVSNRHQLSALAATVARMPDLEVEISKLWSVTVLLSQIEDIRKKIMENDPARTGGPGRVYACYCVKFFNFLKDSTSSLADSINRELRKEGVTARDFCLFISRIYRKASLRAPVPARAPTTDEIKEGLKMYGFTGVSPPKCVDVLKRVWNRSIRKNTGASTSSSSSDSSDYSSLSDDSLSSSDLSSFGSSTSSGSSYSSDSSTSSGSSDSSDWHPDSRKRSRRGSLTRSSGSNRNLRKRSRRRSPISDSRSNRHLRRRSERRSSPFDFGSNRNQRRRSGRGSWTVMNRESSPDN